MQQFSAPLPVGGQPQQWMRAVPLPAAPAHQQQILAVFKPNAWLKKSDIARASDVDIGMAGYYLKQLVDEGKLSAIGATGDRMFALHGTAGATGSAPPPKAAKAPRKGPAGKRAKTPKAPKPKAAPKA